ISSVLNKINEELKNEDNLTLAIDGWCDPLGKSIYAFVIITPNRKQYIHSLVDASGEFHTGIYNADEIEKVLTSIGPEKFVAVLKTQPEIFHDSSVVKAIIQDHQFWHEVEKFQDVLAPAKRAVKNI
ncbi:5928_t:CDS:2, partial [Entrophospora sp. SA101]